MPEEELETLRMSALLHDVGKIAIDDRILKKPAALTDEEYEIMKTHPQRGYKIMSQIPAMKDLLARHVHASRDGQRQGLSARAHRRPDTAAGKDRFGRGYIRRDDDRPSISKGPCVKRCALKISDFIDTRYDGDVVKALIDACKAGEVANGIVRQARPQSRKRRECFRHRGPNDVPLKLGDESPHIPAATDNPLELGI